MNVSNNLQREKKKRTRNKSGTKQKIYQIRRNAIRNEAHGIRENHGKKDLYNIEAIVHITSCRMFMSHNSWELSQVLTVQR